MKVTTTDGRVLSGSTHDDVRISARRLTKTEREEMVKLAFRDDRRHIMKHGVQGTGIKR